MAWEDLTLPARRAFARANAPRVTLAVRPQTGGCPLKLALNLNAQLATVLGWQGRQQARPQIDRERGLLRLVLGHGRALAGKADKGLSYHLDLTPLPWVAQERRPAEPVGHRVENGALIVVLPDWARPPVVASAVPAPRAAATTPPRPTLGNAPAISARDQAAEIRREIAELRAAGKQGRAIADETGLPLSEVLAHIAAIDAAARAGRAA